MTREELKKAMPILTAFVEGKTIQCYDHNTMFKGYGVHKIIYRSEWKCIIKYQKATKWLYIDDLFSKKEGKS